MSDTPSSSTSKQLYLIDAMALAYRSHFIFISRPLINSKGQNTSASYGFTNALLKLIEEHEMDHMAVVFDVMGPGETFRSEMYEDYKAHREPPPDDLLANLPWIKEIVTALDIPVIEQPLVEADDVIGTLARRAEADGAEVIIVSPDKDFQQLLSPQVSIFRPAHRGEDFDPITADSFREKHGVEPIQFIDMLALMGDTSDNVPGVPGIGPKTAAKLIAQYDTVENLLAHTDEIKGKKARQGLLNHPDDALLSKKLVTIKTDLEVDLDWHTLKRVNPDRRKQLSLFRELEFRTLTRRLEESGEVLKGKAQERLAEGVQVDLFGGGDDPALEFDFGPYEEIQQYDPDDVDYRIIRSKAQLAALAEELAAQDRFALDTETTSVDAMMASLVGISVSWKEKQGVYIPTPLPDGTSTDAVLAVVGPLFNKTIVGQNLKYDMVVLARHGAPVQGILFDTMVAHYLVAPEGEHNLDALCRQYLSYRTIPISDLIGKGKNQRSMRDVPIDEVGPYACEDADLSLRLADILKDELEKNDVLEIAEKIEFPLI